MPELMENHQFRHSAYLTSPIFRIMASAIFRLDLCVQSLGKFRLQYGTIIFLLQ